MSIGSVNTRITDGLCCIEPIDMGLQRLYGETKKGLQSMLQLPARIPFKMSTAIVSSRSGVYTKQVACNPVRNSYDCSLLGFFW